MCYKFPNLLCRYHDALGYTYLKHQNGRDLYDWLYLNFK